MKSQKPKNKAKRIVVIGGGTGSFVALSGLKKYPVDLCAIVTMMDSGGSTGRLRDQLGVLPPGDIRQCLVALSESGEIWRKLFTYRFANGDLYGHNFGNIFLSSLEKITGSFKKAITVSSRLLKVKGDVIPVTFGESELCVKLKDGRIIEGETHIDEPKEELIRPKIEKAFLKPSVRANPLALDAILRADLVLIGPGDLYTSLLANLLVEGVVSTLRRTKAKIVYVLNLMTKFGQTTDYLAKDHIEDIEKYLGKDIVDFIIVNSKKPDKQALNWYKKHSEVLVKDDLRENNKYQIIRGDILYSGKIKQSRQDLVVRSFIRHDPSKLARIVISLLDDFVEI